MLKLCLDSNSVMTKEERLRQRNIECQLRQVKANLENECKLLLLGGGESGKSTIAKQMRILHLKGFTQEERLNYKEVIHSNVLYAMRALVLAAHRFEIPLSQENANIAHIFTSKSILAQKDLTPDLAAHVISLWNDEGIKACYVRANEFQLSDSAEYYFDSVARIVEKDYIPTDQDILRARAKTTGVAECEFELNQNRIRLVDVGGQRSERKKWIHCFQDVTSVLFCVALSEYNQQLYEDETINRMHESLKLFDEICNGRWFNDKSIILFLNKSDIFAEKIKKVDLKVCFPEYRGGCHHDRALDYIKHRFESLNPKTSTKKVYTHTTCATDTTNIKFVFKSVADIVLHQNLAANGLV